MSRLEAVCNALRVGNLAQFAHDVDFVDKEQYLTEVLERALQHREARRVERLIKQARFPAPRTFEGYEFEPITFPSGIDKDGLMNLAFLERRENVLCIGAVGTGKTHLAIALGMKACMQGKSVRFYRAVELTTELADRRRKGTLGRFQKQLEALDLLIIDELGYIPFDRVASQLLFNVISSGYERQSVIVTSNLEFGRWTEVFGDDRLTAALIDRLVHHAHILGFSGQSYRYKQAVRSRGGDGQDRQDSVPSPS